MQKDYQQAKEILGRKKRYDRIARVAIIVFFIITIIAFFASL